MGCKIQKIINVHNSNEVITKLINKCNLQKKFCCKTMFSEICSKAFCFYDFDLKVQLSCTFVSKMQFYFFIYFLAKKLNNV